MNADGMSRIIPESSSIKGEIISRIIFVDIRFLKDGELAADVENMINDSYSRNV